MPINPTKSKEFHLPFHCYIRGNPKYKPYGKTRFWDGGSGLDSKKLFEQHIRLYPKKMKPWLKTVIKYESNIYGFRCSDPLTNKFKGPIYMAVGCSKTYGTGVIAKQAWPEQLGKMLPGKMYNMGVGGCSLETCYRLVKWWLPLIKPNAIFMLMPTSWRRELIFGNRIEQVSEGHLLAKDLKKIGTGLSDNLHQEYILDAMHYNCQMVGTKLCVIAQNYGKDQADQARDLVHPGPKQHRRWAGKFYYQMPKLLKQFVSGVTKITKNIKLFNKLNDETYLINVSRGKVQNEKDILKAIKIGKLSGAFLDVFEELPWHFHLRMPQLP